MTPARNSAWSSHPAYVGRAGAAEWLRIGYVPLLDAALLHVGSGKLLICSADLAKDLGKRPAALQLRESLLSYMAGKRFNPKVAVSKDDLARLLEARSYAAALRADVPPMLFRVTSTRPIVSPGGE